MAPDLGFVRSRSRCSGGQRRRNGRLAAVELHRALVAGEPDDVRAGEADAVELAREVGDRLVLRRRVEGGHELLRHVDQHLHVVADLSRGGTLELAEPVEPRLELAAGRAGIARVVAIEDVERVLPGASRRTERGGAPTFAL